MEKVYAPEITLATEPIDLKSYFQEYQTECNVCNPADEVLNDRLAILRDEFKLCLDMDDIKDLEALCTIDKLKVPNENSELPLTRIPKDHRINSVHPITPEAERLQTVKSKEYFSLLKDELAIGIAPLSLDVTKDDCGVKDILPGSTFIYKVLVFIPYNTLSGNRLTPESLRLQYGIEVLGTNSLIELANTIECVSDAFITKEVPNMDVNLVDLENAMEEYPSRFIFIENTFYNDMSHPNSIDLSEVVKKWALDKGIGNFTSRPIDGVTFDSLKPRLGYGYVYVHQGNCEHVLCFSDAKLIQSSDCLNSKKYPRINSLKRRSNYLCFICSTSHSTWMVINSNRLPLRKAFFCTKCCLSYMFLNGEKIGDFQLYPYYGVKANLENRQNQVEWGCIIED